MRKCWLAVLLLFSALSIAGQNSEKDLIRQALEFQLKSYPGLHYRDIYKNFMQDYFGPGHLLNDTAAAAKYLRYEIANSEKFDGPDYEPTGYEGNFYRVNLRLVKDGVIPFDIFFAAFVNSVQKIVPPEPEEWMRIWRKIDEQISLMGLTFDDEEQDRADLEAQFNEGKYIAHHSRAFKESNNFHYRIISRENFEQIIRPLICESQRFSLILHNVSIKSL